MGWWLVLALFLYFLCALLIIAEVFIPSGGLISICALACLIGGVGIFFWYSPAAGWAGLVIAVLMIPTVVIMAYRMLPHTKFGRSVTLEPPERQKGDAIADTDELKGMVGEVGVVVTPLRPVGMCDFAGRRVECVAEDGFVDKGKEIKVLHVEGTQLTVRVIEES